MNSHVKTLGRSALVLAAAAAPAVGLAMPATAHGSMQFPLGRALTCYQENPESPSSAACKAAVAAAGPQAFYDWNGVRVGDAGGRHRQVVPDGKLCSAGDPAFRGLDLPRADWPATSLKAGTPYTFQFKVTAVHQGGFQLFITKDGYDPAKPLTWASLESQPFLTAPGATPSNGFYNLAGKIPAGKKGRHIIYVVWQRTDSPEAFYSCSDIVLGGGSTTNPGTTAAPRPPVTTAPRPSATSTPTVVPKPSRPGRPTGSARPTRPGKPVKTTGPGGPTGPKPSSTCSPGSHAHHTDPSHVNLKSTPVAGTTDAPKTSSTVLIGSIAGLTLGGLAGLLFTARRRARNSSS
ncbi:lytic polysaccharide monooxygenase auxiliary activity family 9 protein [Actinocorallia libanotica]|uniref:Chitin-binding type-4 domain-containing protein n=1 Tax=Actinocorallia libanotica TaxID=46162 RepID=A0ABP4C5M8_9ACTN